MIPGQEHQLGNGVSLLLLQSQANKSSFGFGLSSSHCTGSRGVLSRITGFSAVNQIAQLLGDQPHQLG